MTRTSRFGGILFDTLGVAARRAAARTEKTRRRLAQTVAELAAELRPGPGDRVNPAEPADPRSREIAGVFEATCARLADEFDALANGPLGRLGPVTIALFGRTGAGKSTLVEAIGRGDGSTISPLAVLDHTREINEVPWGDLLLVDTPGFGGESWAQLVEEARAGVEQADLVLLCFDSLNQLAPEFATVAEWIAAYGRPAVAVLNSRNRRWRDPDQVTTVRKRASLSNSLRGHASHIEDEFAAIGLAGIPIVAVSSVRAAYARCDPYRAQDVESRDAALARVDRETLLDWSNLPALEALLAEGLGDDNAVHLRLGRLINRVRGELAEADRVLAEQVETPALLLAAQIEAGITRSIQTTGRLTDGAVPAGAVPAGTAGRAAARALAELEVLRGERFAEPEISPGQHVANVATDRLRPARMAARARAADLVEQAWRDSRMVGEDEFESHVYRDGEVRDTAQAVVDAVVVRYAEILGAVRADTQADLRGLARRGVADGQAGRLLRLAGTASGVVASLGGVGMGAAFASAAAGGGVVAAAGAGLVIGAITITPVGLAVIGIGLAILGLAGKVALDRGQRARDEGHARALADARAAVSETFDQVESAVAAACERARVAAFVQYVLPEVDVAITLRRAGQAAASRRAVLSSQRGRVETAREPVAVLREAVAACERRSPYGEAAPRMLWLGESWIRDPRGLADVTARADAPGQAAAATDQTTAGRTPAVPAPAAPASSAPASAAGRADVPASAPGPNGNAWARPAASEPPRDLVPRPRAGTRWLRTAMRSLDAADVDAAGLADLLGLAADRRPRVAVVGDYSSGKSALIRRLLADDHDRDHDYDPGDGDGDGAGPDGPVSGARVTTSGVTAYPWRGLLLVDTPGLASGARTAEGVEHDALARSAIEDAALILHLVTPALSAASDDGLGQAVAPDAVGGSDRLGRTIFVLTRIDELSDPVLAPREFRRAVASKRAELADLLDRLARRAGTDDAVRAHSVLAVAADPDEAAGLGLGAGGAGAGAGAGWDGVAELVAALDKRRPSLLASGADVGVLRAGIGRLDRLAATHDRRAAALVAEASRLGQRARSVEDAIATGEALGRERRAALDTLVRDHVGWLVHAVRATRDIAGRDAFAARLASLGDDPELRERIAEWRSQTRRSIAAWRLAAMGDAAGLAQEPGAAPALGLDVDLGRLRRRRRDYAATLGRIGGPLAKPLGKVLMNPARVARNAERVGGPAGTARMVARFGGGLQIAIGAAELTLLMWDRHETAKSERARAEELRGVEDRLTEAVERFEDSLGSLVPLADDLDELARRLPAMADEQRRASDEAGALSGRAARCRDAIARARRLLGAPGTPDDPRSRTAQPTIGPQDDD